MKYTIMELGFHVCRYKTMDLNPGMYGKMGLNI